MSFKISVSDVKAFGSSLQDRAKGLLCYVVFLYCDSLWVRDATIRRTLDGRFVLTFSGKRDKYGFEQTSVIPKNEEVRREIEFLVFQALGIEQFLSPERFRNSSKKELDDIAHFEALLCHKINKQRT